MGLVKVTSDVTFDAETAGFCALYLGGHIFNGVIKTFSGNEDYQIMKREIIAVFEGGKMPGVIRLMDNHFGKNTYSLSHLFRDEQRKILNIVSGETMEQFEHAFRLLYENHEALMEFYHEAGTPVPGPFLAAAAFILNHDMKKVLSEDGMDAEKIRVISDEIKRWNVALDSVDVEFVLRRKGEVLMDKLLGSPWDISILSAFHKFMEAVSSVPVDVNFWQIQNAYYKMGKTVYKEFLKKSKEGNAEAAQWVELYRSAGEKLFFNTKVVFET